MTSLKLQMYPPELSLSTKWHIHTSPVFLVFCVCFVASGKESDVHMASCAWTIEVNNCFLSANVISRPVWGAWHTSHNTAQFDQSELSCSPIWQKACLKFTLPLLKLKNKALILPLFSAAQHRNAELFWAVLVRIWIITSQEEAYLPQPI